MKKSDLKNFDIVELRNGDRFIKFDNVLYSPRIINDKLDYDIIHLCNYNEYLLEKSKLNKNLDIMKVKNFDGDDDKTNYIRNFNILHKLNNLWTWEREEPILTEKEKNYLKAVIAPIKDRVKGIEKRESYGRDEYILIVLNGNDNICLYSFEKGTEFKGMEKLIKYTLEELGLD